MPDAPAESATPSPGPALAALGALAGRLTGPILGKELRVASRRRRTYALRAAYVLGLAGIAALVFSFGSGPKSAADTARNLVVTIVWFQFVAAQLMAVFMLGGAVADERRRRTLDVLLVTPITGAQFILGKALSALLQIALVIALSFPVLGIVRVFGGVPWDYVTAGTATTLTATLVAGALALACALRPPQHARTPGTVAAFLLILWHVGTLLAGAAGSWAGKVLAWPAVCAATNPFCALLAYTYRALAPGRGLASVDWPLHCALMAALTALLLLVALRGTRSVLERRTFEPERRAAPARREDAAGADEISEVSARPVYWKDARPGRRRARKLTLRIAEVAGIGSCAAFALVFGASVILVWNAVIWLLWLFALISTLVLAARSIAGEKEGRTWALVLATPLSDARIVGEKALAVLRRTALLWLLVLGGNLVFAALPQVWDDIGIVRIALIPIQWASHLFVLLGIGLYWSSRCRTSTAATAWALGSALGLFLLQQLLFGISTTLFFNGRISGTLAWLLYNLGSSLPFCLVDIGLGLLLLRGARRCLRRSAW